ncbi:hypothetical protein KKE60_05675 [Patescibacteria group bacterium]|nr:hypothetical protein [Patescibacteria group bacterium]
MARLDDGYQTLISFAADPTVLFYEKTVTPPGVEGGGAIETTQMDNTAWRTFSPKSLLTLTNAGITVAYDPACYDEIIALVNVNTVITITFPDASTLAFNGYLDKFTPNVCAEGEQPTAEIDVVCTNINAGGTEEGIDNAAIGYTAPPV